ncbi:MAG: hemolysin family protein [Trueperaceae bacterium]
MIAAILLVVILLILINSLYVAAEFATISSRRARVADLASEGNVRARALLPILEDRARLDRYIAGCQVGITLSSLLVGFYGQAQLTPIVAPLLARLGLPEAAATSVSVIGVLLSLTFFQVVFGELLPKSIALRFPERVSLLVLLPMRWSLVILRPLIYLLNGSALFILKRFGRSDIKESHVHHPDELEAIFSESASGGLIDASEREMLSNVFHLSERVARQIMIPRTRIVAAPLDAKPGELIRELVASPHTRFPVFEGSIDGIRGFIHLRELYALAKEDPSGDLRSIVHPMPVLPEFLSVTEVWARLRLERSSMAAIFDEYGGVEGIVTIEDVLEEVFGELQDEFDQERELFQEDSGGYVTLRGDLLVSEVNERFLLALPEERADTIGGLVMDRLERVARDGDEVVVAGVKLQVTEVQRQAVRQVRFSPDEVERERGGPESHG